LIKPSNLVLAELVEVPGEGGPEDDPIGCSAYIGDDPCRPCNKPVTVVVDDGRWEKQLWCSECHFLRGGEKIADIDSYGVELPDK